MALEKDEREVGTCSWYMLEIDVKTEKVLRVLYSFPDNNNPLVPSHETACSQTSLFLD